MSKGSDLMIAMATVWEPDEIMRVLERGIEVGLATGENPTDVIIDAIEKSAEGQENG